MDRPAADQLGELVARIDAAAPGIGVIVDADLVELRRVDAVEPVGDVAELDGVAVPDDDSAARRSRGRERSRKDAAIKATKNSSATACVLADWPYARLS